MLLTAGIASAQDVQYAEKTEYSFDDDVVTGDLVRPDGELTIVRKKGKERFFDLEIDPRETTNLLSGNLSPAAKIAYQGLKSLIVRTGEDNLRLRKEFGPVSKPPPSRIDKKALRSLGYI
jgi:hypothetical protein